MPNQKVFQKDEISKYFWILLNGEGVIYDGVNNESSLFNVGDYAGNFDDQMMQYSLKTVMKSEFAMLRKEQYEHVVQKRDENEFKRITKLFMNTTIFEDFQTVILKKYINSFEKRTYQYNNIIYDENQPVDGIYIIDSGQFSILKSKVIDSSKSYNDSNPPSNKAFVRLSVLQQQCQVFGQEEIFRSQNHRRNRVVCCMNNSKVFFLKIQDYSEMFKSTSDKTISNLICKEKNSQQMRDNIVQARNQLDEVYKNFLYQSNISPPFQSYKNFDQGSLAELQQLQVPSTKRTTQLFLPPSSIQLFLPSSNSNLSPTQNLIQQDNQQSSEKIKNSPGKQFLVGITNNYNINNIQYNNGGNNNNLIHQGNSLNCQMINNTMSSNNEIINSNQSGNQKLTDNISIINQNTQQTQKEEQFMEENDILAIHQRQKLQNIQEILEKNKHLQQNLTFLKDEDVLQELQRNKSNNITINIIQNRIKESILKKKQNSLKKSSNSLKKQKTQESKNEDISLLNGSIYRERSFYDDQYVIQNNQKINNRVYSIQKQNINGQINPKYKDQSQFFPTQYIKEENTLISTPTIKNNYQKQILEERRKSLKSYLLTQKSRQNKLQSFQNIYDKQDNDYSQRSYKSQIYKLNKSEEVSPNKSIYHIQKTNKADLSVYNNMQQSNQISKRRNSINKSVDYQNKYGLLRDFIPKQIFYDNSSEKIKNEDSQNQIIQNSEIMSFSDPKNKIIENYIDKYIKRAYKMKIRNESGIPSQLDSHQQQNQIFISNEQQTKDIQPIKSNDHLSSKQNSLPLIENPSNLKFHFGGNQHQSSINKQFLRKSRRKIKQKFHKAIEDKLLIESSVDSRLQSPLRQEFSQEIDLNKSGYPTISSKQQLSPQIIKNTPKLHKIQIGIDMVDFQKN